MNSDKKIARIAGFMLLLSLLVPLLNWVLVLSKFIAAGNAIDTARNILANEFLFRINIINELITSAVAAVLALALYIILKSVNRNLALLALSLKIIESILWAVIALGHFMALLILNEQASLTVFEPEQVQALAGSFINVHISATAVPGVFAGMNLMVFFYLLFKSKYVPPILAGSGILSYAFIFVYDSMTILSPDYAAIMIIQIISWSSACLPVIITGLWLLIKGVNVKAIREVS